VIVGAGPAGSTAAILLARAGLDVVLLDRRTFPRAKPCGDCLSPNVSRLLDRLGMLDAVLATRPARLTGWRIVSPGGASFSTRFDDITGDPLLTSSLAVSRDRFDATLLDGARSAGAEVLTGHHVKNLLPDNAGVVGSGPDGSTFHVRARLTVGADGLRSVVARRMGAVRRRPVLRKVSLTAHIEGVRIAPDQGEMHLAHGLCAGLAPVSVGSRVACNVTVVADALTAGRDIARDAAGFFRHGLTRFPLLAGRFDDTALADLPASALLASGPFDMPVRRTVWPGVALTGDAAGYYDPFTGQGINQAIEGAFLLAQCVSDALGRDARSTPDLDRYAREHRRLVRGPRAVQRIMEFALSRAGLADRLIARLAYRPAAARTLIAAIGDIAPAAAVASPAVLLALAVPLFRENLA